MDEPRSKIARMDPQRHYPKAPITEAIIDLRVELPSGIGLEELRRAHAGQEQGYPHVTQIKVASSQIHLGDEVTTTASTKPLGHLIRSGDGKQIYQARLNGFTMSRLAPYDRWEPFRDEARRLWNVYKAAVSPQRVVRVAVRYVNRIDIPLPLHDFKDYLRTVPEVSPDLPQGLAGYFMRLQIPMEDIKSGCLLNEAIIKPATPNVASVVLDIDVFRDEGLPTEEAAIWESIEDLRIQKNSVFEACITDKARELFQ